MKEKTTQEQTAAARQTELLIGALGGASADGHWLNMAGKQMPRIYPKGAKLSPFNSLILGLNSDANGFRTSLYTTFNDAKKRGEAVMKDERSVPMNWYRWDSYVNRHDEKDIVSREDYQKLSPEQQSLYKAVRQREIHSLFNIEQTTLPNADAAAFEKACQQWGGIIDRGNLQKEERQLRSTVAAMREQIAKNLVPIKKATTGTVSYDSTQDVILMPDQKHFAEYRDYVQELLRQTVSATGHQQRLAREGMVMHGGKAPSEQALRYERLVSELASGVKMMELGLPAKLSPESLPLVDYWKQELQENHCLIDAIESDVNAALDVIRKAEHGERLEFASARNRQQTEELREQSPQRPQVSASEALILEDIMRHGGMKIDVRNFPGGEQEKKEFTAKFCNLDYYEDQVNVALYQAKERLDDPELINVAYTQAASEAARIHSHCAEWMPKEWEEKGSHFIAEEIAPVADKRSKEFVVVRDTQTGIVDVILPAGALGGGDVVMSNGDKRNYWLTPDEVMAADERKEAGARTVTHSVPGFNKEKIATALMEQGASYVRFYNKEGALAYHPDDAYFQHKEVFAARLNGKAIDISSHFDVGDAVKRATEVQFKRVQMLRDDNGQWSLLLQAENQPAFCIHPDKEDTNRFFSTLKQRNDAACGAVRNELAQKYYALAQAKPELRFNIFGDMPDGVDPLRIAKVSIFKTKEDKMMLAATIDNVRQQAKEISPQQWQRLWVAEDINQYKTTLAANVFLDVLRQQKQEAAAEVQQKEDVAVVQPDVAQNFPNLAQYDDLKSKHPETILLFRVGDDYEAYKEDSVMVAQLLGIDKLERVDPKNNRDVEMVSFPHNNLDIYLPRLIRAGERVAICDQLEQSVEKKAHRGTPEVTASEQTPQRSAGMHI